MVAGILRLATQVPKLAKRVKLISKDGGKSSGLDFDRNIFSDKEFYKNKMRGQINTTAAGGSSGKYDPNFVGPRKGLESILSKHYTGGKPRKSGGEQSTALNPNA